jgi:uncharacterized phage protein gp47/JayE
MAYPTAVSVDEAGCTAPTYQEILTYFKDQYKAIMGSDAVVSNDSKTGQLLAIIAAAQSDSNSATIGTYKGFSPTNALGTYLSSLVKINGISRLVATNSTAIVRCTGVAGTIVNAGEVKDANNNIWILESFIIPATPDYIDVLATAKEKGSISASNGSINIINTVTLGWQTAVNITDATPGNPVETDYELRARQEVSTAFPAISTYDSIIAGALNISGVSDAVLYENYTDITDSNSLPPHSISLATIGGSAIEIATMLANKKAPGANTYGSVTEFITLTGTTLPIAFSPADEVILSAEIVINAFNSYTSTIGANLIQKLHDYIQSQGIGKTIYLNSAIAAIAAVRP